jgi:hypothetical protein
MTEGCPVSAECSQEPRLVALEQQDNALHKALDKFDTKLDAILTQVSKIAVLEANHSHHSDGLGRAFKAIADLNNKHDADDVAINGRLSDLEKFMNKTTGMAQLAYILWGAMGGGLILLTVKVLFFMGSNGVV